MVCGCRGWFLHWSGKVRSRPRRKFRRVQARPRSQKPTPKLEEVRPSGEGVAKNLIDQLYGPDGPAWGTKLTELEDLVLAVRELLSEKMLADALARQAVAHAHRPTAYRTCPGCQQPLAGPDTNPRILDTRAGEVAWAEPEGYCDRCRRSFFPSVQEPGP